MSTKRLGEILIEREAISKLQLGTALFVQHENGGRLGDILVSLGVIDESQYSDALLEQIKSLSDMHDNTIQQ